MGGGNDGREQARAQTQAAQVQSQAAVQAAQIAADGSLAASGLIAGATSHAAGLQFAAGENSLAEQRRQFDQNVERLQPFVEVGEASIDAVAEAGTLEGFANRLSQISDTAIFNDLVFDRQQAASSVASQSGLTRSGAALQQASDINAGTALELDSTLYGRQFNNVNVGQAAAAGQANLGQNFANAVTGINTSTAANAGNIITNGAQSQGNLINNAAFQTASGITGAANAQSQGIIGAADARAQGSNNLFNTALSGGILGTQAFSGSSFFSDENLKDNMEKVGKIADLNLYEWDWKPAAAKLLGTEMNIGFKAQEVEQKYPDCVVHIGDFLAVDYPKLHDKLEQRLAA